ncbi:MAG: hypothetical protein GY913_12040 [Proteobacteria bacterium]|nr:hypothetical protein [Pseudomonadota bacterium]MCP4917646.1 hypothetical protein [Pseudomonadota bacterium]
MLLLIALFGCRNKDYVPAGDSSEPGATDSSPPDSEPPAEVDADGDGFNEDDDCDDNDSRTYPGAEERCDEVDNDCDGDIDEDVQSTWYADADGDSFGDGASTLDDCDPPDGYVGNTADCDDTDGAVYPGQVETCNELDDNCDGQIDEGVQETFYEDADADGYGTETTVDACEVPAGYAAEDGDCDDAEAAVNPGAVEVCNGIDDDCDGDADTDATDATTWWVDADGDGHGGSSFSYTQCEAPSGTVDNSDDCDDLDADVSPDGTEVCNDVDDDCNGSIDDNATDWDTWYADSDSDGYGDASSTTEDCDEPSGYTDDDTDCDDTDSAVYPGAPEVPADGTDQSCDGVDGCTDLDCDGTAEIVFGQYYTGSSYDTTSYIYTQTGGAYDDSSRTALDTHGTLDHVAEDFDQDGYVDIVFASYYSSTDGYAGDAVVYWGSASGHSASDTTELPSDGIWHMLADDLDGDGYTDLVLGTYYDGSGYTGDSVVYYGSATGFDASAGEELDSNSVVKQATGDLNGDGYTDLVLCSYYGSTYVHYGSASGFTSSGTVSAAACYDVEVSDLNGDGYDDAVFGRYSTLGYIYWGTSSGISASYLDTLTTGYARGVEIADMDGDGYDDVVFGGYSSTTYVYYNSSIGFSSSVYTGLSTYGCWDVQVADLDSDGYPEVVCPVHYDGSYYTDSLVFWGSASGPDDSDVTELETEGSINVAIGDLDADGYPELVFSGYYAGDWTTLATNYVYYGSSTGYDSADFDNLDTDGGTWSAAVLVGDTDW